MYHFFVEPSQVYPDEIEILGGDVNHIKNVLRMRPGEEIQVSDMCGHEYRCRITAFAEDGVRAEILEYLESGAELSSRLVLFQGLPKSDKMELIIQKAVELGAAEIVPVQTHRCVVRLDAKKEENKRKRWQAIAESAAKQSGRSVIPEVKPVVSFAKALEQAGQLDRALIPYEHAAGLEDGGHKSVMEKTRETLAGIRRGMSVGILIGPEGGFEEEEIRSAIREGIVPVTLGKRILRTETAGLCILSVLMFQLEE